MKSNILKTTESYLVEVRAKHGNLYDYSDVEYISAKDKIKVRCFVHGYFLQNPFKYSIDFDNQFRHIELYNKNLNFYGISIISTLTDN